MVRKEPILASLFATLLLVVGIVLGNALMRGAILEKTKRPKELTFLLQLERWLDAGKMNRSCRDT